MAKTIRDTNYQKLEASDLKPEGVKLSAAAAIALHAGKAAMRYNGPLPRVTDKIGDIATKEEVEVLESTQRHLMRLEIQSEAVGRLARIEAVRARKNVLQTEAVSDNPTRSNLLSADELEKQMTDAHDTVKRVRGPVTLKALPAMLSIMRKAADIAATKARETAEREIAEHEALGVDYAPSNVVRAWHQIGEKAVGFCEKDHAYIGHAPDPRNFLRRFCHGLLEIPDLSDDEKIAAIDALNIDLRHEGEKPKGAK